MLIMSIAFDADLIYVARRRGFKIAIVPVALADRRGSRMDARPKLAIRVAWDLIRIPFGQRNSVEEQAMAPNGEGSAAQQIVPPIRLRAYRPGGVIAAGCSGMAVETAAALLAASAAAAPMMIQFTANCEAFVA